MPAKKPARKPVKKMPPPRVSILAEDKLTPAQRGLLDSIRSGLRRARAAARRPLPLQDGGGAAALRIRHLGDGKAVARAIRVVRPRAPGRARGRQSRDHPRPAEGTRPEIGPEGRARDLRFRPGTLQD